VIVALSAQPPGVNKLCVCVYIHNSGKPAYPEKGGFRVNLESAYMFILFLVYIYYALQQLISVCNFS
jgi:hypothetical protein